MTAARLSRCAPRGIRTGRGGFSGFTRVVTGGDGFLDLLDVGQLRVARCHSLRGIYMRRLTRQQFTGHGHAAAASEGQFLAVLQMNGDGAFRAGDQLIADKQAIPLNQCALSTVGRLSENLANDFSDCANERCHVKSSAADHRRHW